MIEIQKERFVFIKALKNIHQDSIQKIIVVDDSVDTGHSMKQVVDAISNKMNHVQIKVAGLNVWDKSEDVIKIRFCFI